MPSINYKQASQRLNVGGSPGGVSPSALRVPTGGARPAQVNVNVGGTQFTPMPIPDFIPDKVLEGAQHLGTTLVDATMKLRERRDKVLANEANLELKNALRNSYKGYTDEAGNVVKGYEQLRGIEANDSYAGYANGVKDSYNKILSALEPSVRQKAVIRMGETMNYAINSGSDHNIAQLGVAEQQVQYAENQEVLRSIETTGAAPWTNGEVQKHLSSYQTQVERDAAVGQLATFTLYEAYNQTLKHPFGELLCNL